MNFVTNGTDQYEIHGDRMMKNFGRAGGELRVVIARKVSSDAKWTNFLDLAECHRCHHPVNRGSWHRLGYRILESLIAKNANPIGK